MLPPNAAWTVMAFLSAIGVRMSRVVRPACASSTSARGGSACDLEPDGLSRRSEGRVRHGKPERLGDHLRGSRRAQELTAAAGTGARPAAEFGGFRERDFSVDVARTQRLDLARVLALARPAA